MFLFLSLLTYPIHQPTHTWTSYSLAWLLSFSSVSTFPTSSSFLRLSSWPVVSAPLCVALSCEFLLLCLFYVKAWTCMRVRTLKAKSSIEAPFSGSLLAPNLNNLTHSYSRVSSYIDSFVLLVW